MTAISAAIQPPNDTPTSDRIAQVHRLQQIEIEIGEIVDRGHVLRLLGAAEARMRRRDHARLRGELLEHRRVGLDADAGMEEQQRPPGAGLDHLDAHAGDGLFGCAHGSFFPPGGTSTSNASSVIATMV